MPGDADDGDPKIKMPIHVSIPSTEEKASMGGLKSYTAYCIQVSDFGKSFMIERRFDDFGKLHSDLAGLDPGLPQLPEKKMFASTDATVVAERKPAFEKLLRYLLKSETVVFDSGQAIWKFLELPATAMVAVRFLHKNRRLAYVKQCGKLLDAKYEKEHAFRLCHESILKTNLFLLTEEGEASLKNQASTLLEVKEEEVTEEKKDVEKKETDVEGTEGTVIEMIRYAVANGGEETRKRFLSEGGLNRMMSTLRRIAERAGSSPTPDQRVRSVLNALIHAEGDNYPSVFARFLREGGMASLVSFQDLCTQHAAFAEFIGKALWLSWELETQQAFFSSGSSEALGLLSAFFSGTTKSGRIMAGLLLTALISNDLFADDRDREAKAAAGLSSLVDDLIGTMHTAPGSAKSKESSSEDIQAAEAFLASVGRNERGFARVIACAACPAQVVAEIGGIPEGAAIWSSCAFALWCLVKVQPKAARVAPLRPWLPTLGKAGPFRVRWLVGELLLQLHMNGINQGSGKEAPTTGQNGSAPATEGGATGSLEELGAEATAREQTLLEAAMSEQISHVSSQLQAGQQGNSNLLQQQQHLAQIRMQELATAAGGGWTAGLDVTLKKLAQVREQLVKVGVSAQEKEAQSAATLEALSRTESQDAVVAVADVQQALVGVHEVETVCAEKVEECDKLEAALKQQSETSELCKAAMEEASNAVLTTRKRITDTEQELTSKQKQAQYQRTLALTDSSSQKDKATGEIQTIDKTLEQMREKVRRFQAGEPAPDGTPAPDSVQLQEVMTQLRAEATQLKQRRAELQAELQNWQKLSEDPDTAQTAAMELERQASELQEQLTLLRTGELAELERAHGERREAWQLETEQLSRIRSARDHAARERTELERQLTERWQRWRPLWSQRLSRWHERAAALADAQVRCRSLEDAVTEGWDLLRAEDAARHEVLVSIGQAQEDLSRLAQQIASVGDLQ